MNAPRSPGRIHPARPPTQVVKKSPRRLFRSSAVMLLGAVLLCVVVTLTRDRNTQRFFLASVVGRCDQIREHWARTRALPPELIDPQDGVRRLPLEYYADADTRFYAARTKDQVIIGYTRMAPMVVTSNGRGVIFLRDGQVTAGWVREGRFQQLLAAQKPLVEALVGAARSRPPALPD